MMQRKTSILGINLIKTFESLHDGDLSKIGLQPKMDPILIWTEGWGHAILDDKGQFIKGIQNKDKAYKFAKVKTVEEADKLLAEDLIPRENFINKNITVPLNQCEFDALVSFAYNIGTGSPNDSKKRGFYWSQVRSLTNKGDKAGAAEKFKLHNKGGGKVLPGLVRRRQAEKELFLKPDQELIDFNKWVEKFLEPLPLEEIARKIII